MPTVEMLKAVLVNNHAELKGRLPTFRLNNKFYFRPELKEFVDLDLEKFGFYPGLDDTLGVMVANTKELSNEKY